MSTKDIVESLASAPLLQAAPSMMREAQKRGGVDGDNLSTIIMRWDTNKTDDSETTETSSLSPGEFSTQLEETVALDGEKEDDSALSDNEIERAIAEIQDTIRRFRR